MKIVLKNLLVPTDFSDKSEAALTYGVALATTFGATLHLLHVLEAVAGVEPLVLQLEPRHALESEIEASAWDELRRLLSPADCARLNAQLALEWGTPVVEIIRYARTHAIDLIAMGTHGRSGVQHLLMGSVAENVVRGAPCPVLTVHHPEHEFVLLLREH
jgi:nucleotide-binding universal stress UspA family protein